MTLPAVPGNDIYASDLYGLCQPSGGTESGTYIIAGWSSGNGQTLSTDITTRSRGATPVSVALGGSPTLTNMAAPTTTHLDANGFQVWGTSNNGAQNNCFASSSYTVQY